MLRGNARKAIAYGTLILTFFVIIGAIGGMNELGAVKASNLSAGPTISQTECLKGFGREEIVPTLQ